MSEPILVAEQVSKNYGAIQALDQVSMEIFPGKVTVLFGENGAGKSTLMKILAGVERPSTGSILLRGEPVEFNSTVDAARHGVSIIHQELSLAPNLSVRDNIFMGREKSRWGVVDYRSESTVTRDLLDRLEESFSADALVGDLRIGQQQVVEIARALAADAQVLIMDEPTSALSGTEVEVLFKVIEELKQAGVAIVYISHHLEEAFVIGDHAVVLRNGKRVATAELADVDLAWVIRQMVGRELDGLDSDTLPEPGEALLEIRDLSVADPRNPSRLAVDHLNLTVHAGEIVALYGLMGAGRTELLEALAGRLPITEGAVLLCGKDITKMSIEERIALGMPLVPEDRQRDGLVQTLSVGKNLSLSSLLRFVSGPAVSKSKEHSSVAKSIAEVGIKTDGPEAPMSSLSGGNQQKVVIGRAMMTAPRLFLLDEPTRGIDVGAKAEIFHLMAEQAADGLGVLYSTSEVGEALQLSSRIVVMAKGRIAKELSPADATRSNVMAASEGASSQDALPTNSSNKPTEHLSQ